MAASKKNISKDTQTKQTYGFKEGHLPNRIEQQEAASYIASIGENLQDIANSADLPFLSYLISLVVEEARQADENEAKQAPLRKSSTA